MKEKSHKSEINEHFRIWIGFAVIFLLFMWDENFQYSEIVLVKWSFLVVICLVVILSVIFIVGVIFQKNTLKELLLKNKYVLIIDTLLFSFCWFNVYNFWQRSLLFILLLIPIAFIILYFGILVDLKKIRKMQRENMDDLDNNRNKLLK